MSAPFTATTTSTSTSECLDDVEIARSPISSITTRWEPLLVTRIENVRVTNMSRFEESKVVNIGSPLSQRVTRDQIGLLCSADLEIVLTVSESTHADQLSMRLENSVTVASRETLVQVGRMVPLESGSPISPEDARNTFRIVVPLTRGLYDRVPLFDEVHTKGKHFVHHTINISGLENGRNCQWRIRVRVDPEDGVVDVVSVNNSVIDMVRLGESWNNFRDLVVLGATKVSDSAKSCWANRKAWKSKNNSNDSSYSALPSSDPSETNANQHQTFVMPAPIPVHTSMYPSVPQQQGQPIPPAGMMFVPAFQPKAAPTADGMPQPQVIYYAMPNNSVWPPVSGSPKAEKPADPAATLQAAPKFELVSEDE